VRNSQVSVIIAAYNAEPVIERSIRSIRHQTMRPKEIIVVDDGSVDRTVDEVRRSGADVIIVQQANAGPGAARNAGVRRATGDLVCFLDADDEYAPRMVETLAAALARHPDAAVASGAYLWDQDGAITRCPPPGALLGDQYSGVLSDFFEASRHYSFVCTNSVMARREAFLAVGGFGETRFGEDLDLWARLAGRGGWVFVDSAVCVYHHNSQTSVTLQTRPQDVPADLLMAEDRMRQFIRPALWQSYRRYRRDWLSGAARGALGLDAGKRARQLVARIAPAPPSLEWLATWILVHITGGSALLRLGRSLRALTRVTARDSEENPGVAVER
jgi:glycosyltransferase involved in cell wall biosynthesis